ncbi:IS200/IS605 family transposase [Candidatus Wolfebacteria bacterium]|nr:IS200/IS605 family transposase [Candidatus Wolfebacteria bacterium]
MRIRHLNHSVYQHQYQIVWGTKYRRKYLKQYTKQEFIKSLYATIEKYPTLYIHSANVSEDHIHIQIEIPPNISVAVAVQKLKQESSQHLKKRFKFIREMYIDGHIWSVGYFSSTIGLNEKLISRYIEYQNKRDLPTQPRLGFS